MSVLLRQKYSTGSFKSPGILLPNMERSLGMHCPPPSSEKKNKLQMPTNARSLKAQVIPHGKSPIPQICQLSTLLAIDSLSQLTE